MKTSTTSSISNYEIIESFGVVTGSFVQSKHIGRDIVANLKGIIGGEIVGYTEMMEEARNYAIQRMESKAERLGANAVVGIKFTSSSISRGMSEILAYGTAVKIIL